MKKPLASGWVLLVAGVCLFVPVLLAPSQGPMVFHPSAYATEELARAAWRQAQIPAQREGARMVVGMCVALVGVFLLGVYEGGEK